MASAPSGSPLRPDLFDQLQFAHLTLHREPSINPPWIARRTRMNHGEDRGKQGPNHPFLPQYRPICTTYWRFAAQLDCVRPVRWLKSKVTFIERWQLRRPIANGDWQSSFDPVAAHSSFRSRRRYAEKTQSLHKHCTRSDT
jgi:hypothetical protein